ncbi:MAG: dihydroxyacetone kinase subunit DhaL [Chloroflexi bacterium]|nr:dihydroxyacetone kinase subunit DhaL [Chloroflexota bacterium]
MSATADVEMLAASDVVAFLRRAAAAISRHEMLLDRLDAALGDGDHGTNMRTGLEAVVRTLDGRDLGDDGAGPGEILRRTGHVLVESVGGASGPLYGTAFIEAGFFLDGCERLDLATLAAALEAGCHALARRGRCAVGDKTILDALDPAVAALSAAAAAGLDLRLGLRRAAHAARDGMRATTPLVARRGLALRLGERSRGHQDPGATSCYLLIWAMAARRDPPVVAD